MIFSKTRNAELSIIQHIEECINSSWSGVTVVKSFVNAYDKKVPVIAVELLNEDNLRAEIGNSDLRQRFNFIVSIFASSDGQRLDLADFILNSIKGGCKYYEYSKESGNNNQLVKTESGRMTLIRVNTNRHDYYDDNMSEQDKYRHSISFNMEKY